MKWIERAEETLFVRSRDLATPWGAVLRLLRFPAALIRDFVVGEINVRATSLAYTTLLSVVPLITFCVGILKFLGARANLSVIVLQFLKPLGASAAAVTASVMQFVMNMRGDVLGWIGFGSLAYTVFAMIRQVEAGFQFVWRVHQPRGLARRIAEYAIVMIVAPLFIAASLGLLASAEESPIERWARTVLPLEWTLSLLGKMLPYAIVTLTFTAMYVLIPNTRVKSRAAFIGGLGAGLAWALVGHLFTAFVRLSTQMLAVYAGFALLLITLIWIYLTWLILLLGAKLSFYVQYPQYLRFGQAPVELSGGGCELAALSVMVLIGRKPGTLDRLADELDLPSGALSPLLGALHEAGLIRALPADGFALARPPEQIALNDVLRTVRSRTGGAPAAMVHAAAADAGVLARVETAIRECLAGETLRDLLAADA